MVVGNERFSAKLLIQCFTKKIHQCRSTVASWKIRCSSTFSFLIGTLALSVNLTADQMRVLGEQKMGHIRPVLLPPIRRAGGSGKT
jgi:hypothetical protein